MNQRTEDLLVLLNDIENNAAVGTPQWGGIENRIRDARAWLMERVPPPAATGETPVRIPEFEATRINADYWLNEARGKQDEGRGDVLMCAEQAINAWKNAAYAAHDELVEETEARRNVDKDNMRLRGLAINERAKAQPPSAAAPQSAIGAPALQALAKIKWDIHNCDWSCERCGADPGMEEADIAFTIGGFEAKHGALPEPYSAAPTGDTASASTGDGAKR